MKRLTCIPFYPVPITSHVSLFWIALAFRALLYSTILVFFISIPILFAFLSCFNHILPFSHLNVRLFEVKLVLSRCTLSHES